MKNRKVSFPVQRLTLALGVAAHVSIGCSGTEAPVPGDDSGTGGTVSVTGGAGPTGGAATGGVATGGVATGGVATGGVATGGVATGGVATGGLSGAGPTGGTPPTAGMSGAGMTGGSAGDGMTGGAGGSGGAGMTGGSGGSGGKAMGGSGGSGVGGTQGNGGSGGGDDLTSGPNTMGWIGCSMGENVAIGYRRIGGTRMWGGYGNGGAVVQQWTGNTSAAWQRFDRQKGNTPVAAVWIMICIFANAGVTDAEVDSMVQNARSHAPGAYIYITGQPSYRAGYTCTLAGDGGVELTDRRAQAAAMRHPDVHYAGVLGPLNDDERSDVCHANATGEDKLGHQARAIWGQP